MTVSTYKALRLFVLSCWLLATVQCIPTVRTSDTVGICEESGGLSCIPGAYRTYLGNPLARSQIASRFKMKARKPLTNNLSKRRVLLENEEPPGRYSLTNNVEISGDPNEDHYNITSMPYFDPAKKVVIIIHGWAVLNNRVNEIYRNQTLTTVEMPEWVFQLQQKIVESEDASVAVHDWRGGAKHGYSQARDNTWTAGKDLALFIKSLYKQGVKPSQIHLIGHSLGCHVAGLAAKTVNAEMKDKVGRITAMDPAQPLYENSPNEVRLTKSDATLVDVYHTDGSSLTFKAAGILAPVGHVDFYPNNGTDQPHCHNDENDPSVAAVCDHVSAYMYFMESLTTKQLAIRCDSYENYLNGKCYSCHDNGCLRVGYFLDRSLVIKDEHPRKLPVREIKKRHYGSYFYQTSRDPDFCTRPMVIEVQLSKRMLKEAKDKKKFGLGAKLKFDILAETGKVFTLEHPVPIDKLLKGLNPETFRTQKFIRYVYGMPCSSGAFPAKQLTVSVDADCSNNSFSNVFTRLMSGSCGESSLHLRRARLREISSEPKIQRLKLSYRDHDRKIILVDA